jgi:hypothetical protein
MANKVKYPHVPGADRGEEISRSYREQQESKEEQEKKAIARALLPEARKLLSAAEQFDEHVAREVRKTYGSTAIGYTAFSSIGNNKAWAREALDLLNKIIER